MAGNVRFHNKFHAYTHYTDPVPGIPDSAMDPIASAEFPFLGNLYVAGCLSARGWLDEDGVCRKFLYDPDPVECRPVKICGDHMEGALHYSHVDYNNTQTYDPKRLEIDFKQHTFKTIVCDASEYHIMPVSLSAGCVTSTRFVNPSANGGVDIAWHPHLKWLSPRPCYLSAGEEAILSMSSFSNDLTNVVCIWKERETELETPFVIYSPTITYSDEMQNYSITTCEPIRYNFIIDDSADVVRLDILGTTILLHDDDGDFIWDDKSMTGVVSAFPGTELIPSIYEMYRTFPSRAGLKTLTDIRSVSELLSRDNIVPFNVPLTFTYGGCTIEVEYIARGSIFFEIRIDGATGLGATGTGANLGKLTAGESDAMYFNGEYSHDLLYYDHYVGDSKYKSSVLDKRIWSKLVLPHDPEYTSGTDLYYTIEQHEIGTRRWWIMKSPDGTPVFQNNSRSYANEAKWPAQNNWVTVDNTSTVTPPELFSDMTPLQRYTGAAYIDGDVNYITDEYIIAPHAGVYYGECFEDWDSYYVAPNNLRVVPEDTSNADSSEYVTAIAIPGGTVPVVNPTLFIDPMQFTSSTTSPTRYTPGQKIRMYVDETVTGDKIIDGKYLNSETGIKSASSTVYQTGGTFVVLSKDIISIPAGVTTIGISLSCVD